MSKETMIREQYRESRSGRGWRIVGHYPLRSAPFWVVETQYGRGCMWRELLRSERWLDAANTLISGTSSATLTIEKGTPDALDYRRGAILRATRAREEAPE